MRRIYDTKNPLMWLQVVFWHQKSLQNLKSYNKWTQFNEYVMLCEFLCTKIPLGVYVMGLLKPDKSQVWFTWVSITFS